jgi:NAD(P)-dependent dehydrogenase (short-subunit alcohol dehydrogenase family)
MAEMDLPDIDLEGRVVIMTGADRGLGRAMSLGLAKKGARLVLASPVMDCLEAVAEEIAAIAGPGRALAVETDITDLESCANCLRAAVDAFAPTKGGKSAFSFLRSCLPSCRVPLIRLGHSRRFPPSLRRYETYFNALF